jgi:hypothetical protein
MNAMPGLPNSSYNELEVPSDNLLTEDLTDENLEDIKTLELSTYSKTAWLQEVAFFITNVTIISISLLVALISIIAKAVMIDIFIRVASTILIFGFLGWVINWLFGKYIIAAKFQEFKEQVGEENEHMVEFNA